MFSAAHTTYSNPCYQATMIKHPNGYYIVENDCDNPIFEGTDYSKGFSIIELNILLNDASFELLRLKHSAFDIGPSERCASVSYYLRKTEAIEVAIKFVSSRVAH